MLNINLNKKISEHRKKHRFPVNSIQWGWFLAGLIDSDGSFTDISKHKPNLTICFHIKDISLAHKIKTFIGFGTVSKIKKKNSCKYVLTNKNGFVKILPLLQNKLKHYEKLRRYILLSNYFNIPYSNIFNNDILHFNLLDNHWLAGFIDGDGSFQIKIIKRKNKINAEVRLQLQIDLEENSKYLLENIKNQFGGYLGYRHKLKSYYYNSTSFLVFEKFVNYLDHYCLCSNKYKEYVLWRRSYFFRKDIIKMVNTKERLSLLKK